MSDQLITSTLDQLSRAVTVSPNALTIVQEIDGPMQSIAIQQLLGRLIATDAAKERLGASGGDPTTDLAADLAHDANAIALVYADPDPALCGWYRKTGASGTGSWSQFEKLTSYSLPLANAAVAAAQAAVVEAQAAVGAAEAKVTAIGTIITAAVRPFASLSARDTGGREAALLDPVGVIPPDRLMPTHPDPFLAWLLSCPGIRWAGDYSTSRQYAPGDIVRNGSAYFLTHDACSSGPTSPASAAQYFEPVPLFDMVYSVVDDTFATSLGTLYPTLRPAPGRGVTWSPGGPGYLVAQVTSGGYLTGANNTYFNMLDIPGAFAEFELEFAVVNNAAPSSTMAFSPDNFAHFQTGSPGGTIRMYHIDDQDLAHGGVGLTLVWDGAGQSYTPSYRFAWRDATIGMQQGRNYRRQVLARGNVLLGVINGRIAYVQVCDQVGALVSAACAVYTQNPEYSDAATETVTVLGDTRFYRAAVSAGETL